MKNTRIQIAKPDIIKHFDEEMPRVLNQKDIAAALSKQRAFWRLAQRTNTQNFIQFLV